ncbi:MAG TPA: glycosyltransferase [Candidatus Acidoferrales bacterium]|nr:glycosyltransferase [Candidatus Acidoferrales bacterium]
MTLLGDPAVSVLVSSRDRAVLLAQLLQSLDTAQGAAPEVVSEILVVDNGSHDNTPALLTGWASGGARRRTLRVDAPGKSRALNRALREARAPLLAFLDDDERVAPGWLGAIADFFRAYPEYHAGVGRVLRPPEVIDPDLLARLACYRTIALFDHGDAVRDEQLLHGANMALRREVFARVKGFNEGLGPGAVGGCEDAELAARVVRAGLRIGYMPAAIVYHTIDPARLTPAAFRRFELVVARSRFAMDPDRARRRALPRLLEATLTFVWWSLLRRPVRRTHARGRMIHHHEVLRLSRRRASAPTMTTGDASGK